MTLKLVTIRYEYARCDFGFDVSDRPSYINDFRRDISM